LKKPPARKALSPDRFGETTSAAPVQDRDPRRPGDDLATAIRRHWRLVALIAAAVTFVAWLAAAVQPKRYRAVSIGAVAPVATDLSNSDVMRSVDTLERRVIVASLAALAGAPVTHRQARASSDYLITAAVLPNTNLFRIEVEGPEGQRAAAIANQVPAILSAQARTMYRLYGVSLVSQAGVPSQPSVPRMERAIGAGLLLGILLGAIVAWLLDRRRSV
jgi:capsular polysaccharide biosynthesis protein